MKKKYESNSKFTGSSFIIHGTITYIRNEPAKHNCTLGIKETDYRR